MAMGELRRISVVKKTLEYSFFLEVSNCNKRKCATCNFCCGEEKKLYKLKELFVSVFESFLERQ
jgi:hypothetical protein